MKHKIPIKKRKKENKPMGRRRKRKQHNKQPTPPTIHLSTLCWCCAKATTGGCSWSAHFIPVKGWEATPTIIKEGTLLKKDENGKVTRDTTQRLSHSYKVHSCPEFIKDTEPQLLNVPRLH
jgi:hypothetical protein